MKIKLDSLVNLFKVGDRVTVEGLVKVQSTPPTVAYSSFRAINTVLDSLATNPRAVNIGGATFNSELHLPSVPISESGWVVTSDGRHVLMVPHTPEIAWEQSVNTNLTYYGLSTTSVLGSPYSYDRDNELCIAPITSSGLTGPKSPSILPVKHGMPRTGYTAFVWNRATNRFIVMELTDLGGFNNSYNFEVKPYASAHPYSRWSRNLTYGDSGSPVYLAYKRADGTYQLVFIGFISSMDATEQNPGTGYGRAIHSAQMRKVLDTYKVSFVELPINVVSVSSVATGVVEEL